jgi:predicted dehydrogenase
MEKVRLGIIGLGIMGRVHADNVFAGRVSRCEVTAVSDTNPACAERYGGVKFFPSAEAMFSSGDVDAVLIATPHFAHTTTGVQALNAGLHVLVEKPISVHKADCERLIAAHRNPKQVFAAVFNYRTDPHFAKIREILATRQLGAVQRVNWMVNQWYRTDAYYASGGWRGTWAGEGGGVLLNQALHQLDLLCWILGRMPAKVRGFCGFGRYHAIEVEDDVTAFLEYGDGASAVFATSTGQAPGVNRLEIWGEMGRITLEDGKLSFSRNEVSSVEFCRTSPQGFAAPPVWNIEIPIQGGGDPHAKILENFVDTIIDGAPLIAPAAEGVHSVELANAMIYSSVENRCVDLPMDGAAYEKCLERLIAGSDRKPRTS